ncbi:hypothetical protein AU195_16570 [Mycobacterium sp. IS-1496]|uniref:DUF2505 domain-containing protein n=1 Tax=Mycobacterium sp. IS-1496 TaxID=1772284 RepID=UPI000741572A|nr:DUF2505 domain-containing protein [Mycobacterium sp. IS-1496]KUI38210.1 hypothetical protein AU195_16570 [Mycobacterium sp. IS-1496]
MSRSFQLTFESPASVSQILAALGDEAYWHARLESFGGGTASLTSLHVDANGVVAADVTVSLLRERLPRLITQLHPGGLAMNRSEKWTPAADGGVRGEIRVAVAGAPLSAVGTAELLPLDEGGSRLTYATTVTVKIPVVGGKIESYVGSRAADDIGAIQHFTTRWITGRS